MKKRNFVVQVLGVVFVSIVVSSICIAAPATQPAEPVNSDSQPPTLKEVHSCSSDYCDGPCFFCEAKKRYRKVTPWLDLGADLRLREVYANNGSDMDSSKTTDEYHYQRYRVRSWAKVKLLEMMGYNGKNAEDISLNIRFVYEPRTIERPDTAEDFAYNEVIIDELNLRWANALGLENFVTTVGRQNFGLGSRWLVLEGTPSDGSRTLFFDAARLTYNMDQADTTFDLIYIYNKAESDWWLAPINNQHITLNTYDENTQGTIFYASNHSIKNNVIDGYFIYKHDDLLSASGTQDLYTFGGRLAGDYDDNWTYYVELAKQFGNTYRGNSEALGANSKLTYHFRDPKSNNIHVAYEYRSGDDDSTSCDEGFDILWGRYPQWSEIFEGHTSKLEGRGPAGDTNYHRIALGWDCAPFNRTLFQLNYNLLFADQNPSSRTVFSKNSNFKGQIITTQLEYIFSRHMTARLRGEVFFPGNYYNNDQFNDMAVFGRAEFVFKW